MLGHWTRLASLLFPLLLITVLPPGTQSQEAGMRALPTLLDLHIAVDSSASITEEQYADIKQSVVTFLSSLPVNRDEVWVSVRPYSMRVTPTIEWTWNTTALSTAIPDLPRIGGETRTDLAIADAIYNLIINGRPGAAKAMVIITDGVTRLPSKLDSRRKEAETLGIGVYAVGVGQRLNLAGLLKIAGNYNEIYSAASFLSDLPTDLMSFVRIRVTTSLAISTTPFNETPFFDPTAKPERTTPGSGGVTVTPQAGVTTSPPAIVTAAGSVNNTVPGCVTASNPEGATIKTNPGGVTAAPGRVTSAPGGVIISTPASVTSTASGGVPATAPGGVNTTASGGVTTTTASGAVTSTASEGVPVTAPGGVTATAPGGVVNNSSSGNVASVVPGGANPSSPASVTTFPGVSTTAPRGVTSSVPGSTTTANGGVTTTIPGGITAIAPGGATTSAPGGDNTTAPGGLTTVIVRVPTTAPGGGTAAPGGGPEQMNVTTSRPFQTTTQPIGKAVGDTTMDRVGTGTDVTTSSPSGSGKYVTITTSSPPTPYDGGTTKGYKYNGHETGSWITRPENGSLSAGICGRPDVVVSGGIGYLRHPSACDRYIQCYPEPAGTLVAVTRQCPVGMYWDERIGMCDKATSVVCPTEMCRSPSVRDYQMAGTCRSFWRCQDGRSVSACCDRGFAYFPGRGCAPCSRCTDPCPEKCLTKRICNKRPDWKAPSAYQLDMGLLGWMTSYCDDGSTFDVTSCSCSSKSFSDSFCRSPFLRLAFDGTDAQHDGIQTHNLLQMSGSAVFSGNSSLTALFSPGQDASPSERQLSLRLRYTESLPFSQEAALLRSSPCGSGDVLFVFADQTTLYVKVFIRHGLVAQAALLTEGFEAAAWKSLELTYSPSTSELTVSAASGFLTYSTSTRVPVRVSLSECGWTFGHPEDNTNLSPFNGRMDDIQINYC